jgi:hypothetical protein
MKCIMVFHSFLMTVHSIITSYRCVALTLQDRYLFSLPSHLQFSSMYWTLASCSCSLTPCVLVMNSWIPVHVTFFPWNTITLILFVTIDNRKRKPSCTHRLTFAVFQLMYSLVYLHCCTKSCWQPLCYYPHFRNEKTWSSEDVVNYLRWESQVALLSAALSILLTCVLDIQPPSSPLFRITAVCRLPPFCKLLQHRG